MSKLLNTKSGCTPASDRNDHPTIGEIAVTMRILKRMS